MANLTDDDRAQVMLITAFILAASFLALAVVLNSVIYTENIATRTSEARGSDAVTYRSDMVNGAEQIIEFVNRNHTGTSVAFSTYSDDFNKSLRSMSNRTATQHAVGGTLTKTTVVTTDEGARIGQFNATGRNFTDIDGDDDWGLADDVNATRSFVINVTDASTLIDISVVGVSVGNAFEIDAGSTRIQVYRNGPITTIENSSGGTCTTPVSNPIIKVTAGTIQTSTGPVPEFSPCPALDYDPGGPTYDIEYENADAIEGNYSLVVNTTSGSTIPSGNYDSGSRTDVPFAFEAVYSATIHVRYETTDLEYETDARALPGESDE